MSRKKAVYSTELKTRLILELLKGEKTVNEIASENNIIPKNILPQKSRQLKKMNVIEKRYYSQDY